RVSIRMLFWRWSWLMFWMPSTVDIWASWDTYSVPSRGFSGSWLRIWATIRVRNSSFSSAAVLLFEAMPASVVALESPVLTGETLMRAPYTWPRRSRPCCMLLTRVMTSTEVWKVREADIMSAISSTTRSEEHTSELQ